MAGSDRPDPAPREAETMPNRVARPRPLWLQLALNLRAAMVLIALLAFALAWVVNLAHTRSEAVRAIRGAGGIVAFEDQTLPFGSSPAKPWEPPWMRRWLGEELFRPVTQVWFSGPIPDRSVLDRLRVFPRLNALILNFTQIDDADLSRLRGLRSITFLSLNNSHVTGPGLCHLRDLKRLRHLELAYNAVGDRGLAELAQHHPQLVSLDLAGTAVTDAGLPYLRMLGHLRRLSLDDTAVTDAGVDSLILLPRLERLSFRETHASLAGIARLRFAYGQSCLLEP
jgi:hypothetical protein